MQLTSNPIVDQSLKMQTNVETLISSHDSNFGFDTKATRLTP
jgi:hypothetical protein